MTLHQLQLVCFAAGSAIHGTQAALVMKRWRHTRGTDRRDARLGFLICALTFFWQFSNFFIEFVQSVGFRAGSPLWDGGWLTRSASLALFPLLFSHMIDDGESPQPIVRAVGRFSRAARYVLWPWTVAALASLLGAAPFSEDFIEDVTLHLMLIFFVMFAVEAIGRHRLHRKGHAPRLRATRATIVASLIAAGMFVVMLTSEWSSGAAGLVQLAAMMTSVPFTIAVGYQMYQFPFMDAFVRESLAGLAVLAAFCLAVAIGSVLLSQDLLILWLVSVAGGLAWAKAPLTRWVERTLMGYSESIEQQEERVGNAIRALTRLDQFSERVSEILKAELDAEWVEAGPEPRQGAEHRFEISGPSIMWLSLGPRVGGRHYMSRHLRLARTAALQLAAHRHQLSRHELRDLTVRAQVQALQAQINPHFLFNTLNVLASLIQSNPAKAEQLTEELAGIFRYALESTRLEWVRLEDELRFLESYLEIERTRFDERLSYSFEIEPAVRDLRIPPMILQPVVENAVRHGIGPKIEGGFVRVRASLDGGNLVLTVEDSGVGYLAKSRHQGSGIGLANVRQRLKHVYGDSVLMRLEENEPEGTRVLLVLPQLARVHS